MSEYVWQSKVSRRTAYKQRQDEKKEQAKEEEEFLKTVSANVEPLPFNVVDGQCEERVEVPEGCAGIIIGKKGERLKGIQEKLKVTIKVEDDKKAGSQVVIIRGKSYEDVAAAIREVDFASEIIEVSRHMVGWVCGKGSRHLKLIREMTGVAVLAMRDDRANDGDPDSLSAVEHDDGHCWLEIRGTRNTVLDARMCLDAHISYYTVFEQMGQVETELDRSLAEANAEIGQRPGQPNRGGGPPVSSSSAAATSPGVLRSNRGGRGRGRQQQNDVSDHAEPKHENGNELDAANVGAGRRGGRRSRGRGQGRGEGLDAQLDAHGVFANSASSEDTTGQGNVDSSSQRGKGGRRGAGRSGRSERSPVGMG